MRRQPMQVGSQFSGTHKADDQYIGSLYKKYNLDRLIRLIFANGEQGFAYDPNDLTTLFQDSAGTIPVTSTGQPVGLVLDKSKGLKLGAELFIESDVSVAGQSSKLDGTRYRVYCPDGIESSGIRLMGKFIAGKWYLVEFTIDSVAFAGEGIAAESTQNQLIHKTVGRKRVLVLATNANFYLKRIGVCDYTVSSISVKEIAGNHAYQTVSASRPVLRQTPIRGNELVVNGDFSAGLANWAQQGTAVSSVTAGVLSITAQGSTSGVYQDIPTVVGRTYELDFRATGGVRVLLYANSGFAPAIPNSNTPRMTFVATSSVTRIYTYCNSSDTGTVDNISVKEITGYRTDQNYLEFDGVDDFLTTNAINFTATDKVSLFTGLRKLSDAAQGSVVELGRGVFLETSGSFVVNAPAGAGVAGYRTYVQGGSASTLAAETTATFPAPISNVLTMRADIANKISKLNVNGIDVSATTGAVLNGNFGNYPLYIGRRAGQYIPFSGHLYGLVGVGRLTTGSETIAIEKAIAKRTGVTLSV